MALTVGELVAFLRVERSAWDRALDKAEAKIKVASTAIRASLDEAGRFDGEGLRSGMDRAAAGAMSLISRLAAIPSAAQGMGGAVSMVGSLSGALGLLPAVALSGASAMAALKIGMSGFSDALSNVDDPEKFNKALDRLAPSARDLAVAIRDVKPAWDDVKQSIQHELFTGVADRIRPLATTYLPLLRDGLGAIAAGFNTAALGIADWLAEAQTSSDVGLIFAATETAVDDLAGATRPLLAAFRDLAAVGAEVLPGLTAGADTAAQRFAKFVHEARQSGRLKEWISGGLSAIGDLARVLGNLGAIAAQVFSALGAGGGGALQTLLTLTGAVREFLSSAQGQEVLTTLGMALGQISTVASGVLLTALRALAPALVDLAPAAAELATQVGSVLSGAIQVAGPAIQGVAGFLRDAMSWLGPTALAVFGLVKAYEAWGVAARLVNTIMSANPWMAIIAGVVLLVTVIVTHWDEIKAYLGKAWDWLVEKAGEAWGWIKEHIVQPLKDAGAWVVRQTQQLGDALSTAWQWCVDRGPGRLALGARPHRHADLGRGSVGGPAGRRHRQLLRLAGLAAWPGRRLVRSGPPGRCRPARRPRRLGARPARPHPRRGR
nr:hypothetical protein GCM10020241_47930 [Streptoalloteichus tenebrarius]